MQPCHFHGIFTDDPKTNKSQKKNEKTFEIHTAKVVIDRIFSLSPFIRAHTHTHSFSKTLKDATMLRCLTRGILVVVVLFILLSPTSAPPHPHFPADIESNVQQYGNCGTV